MAQPKKKTSSTRTKTRRSHLRLENSNLVYCEKCHQPKPKHQICLNCGTYKGREVISK